MVFEQASVFGMIGISLVLAYLSINMDEEHVIAKFLFFLATLGSLLLTSSTIYNIMENDSAPAKVLSGGEGLFLLLILITTLLFIYFGYYFIKQSWSGVTDFVRKKTKFK